ncbi:Helix-turn-helix domain-containing protein [Paenibacillus sp. yr247]|uniref:ArsR/SmtB family transcription factor n=1 Tax=Paenibacillus sp. yr247 TaxID=1761880 RepID=UPI0008820CA8|nr:Helix-turn-helix domain-containing protein [Paenibacillus sp. yr247]
MQAQVNKLQQLIQEFVHIQNNPNKMNAQKQRSDMERGGVYYSGQYQNELSHYRWEPQERAVGQLLDLDGDRTAKILAALGHKQRLDILRSVLQEPHTGPELVGRLNMGTTGQLYHHMKALAGADLLVQEERGEKYTIPGHRALPLLLLLAATADLIDTSDYMDMSEVRNDARSYLGAADEHYDPHLLLWAVVENSILEHLHAHRQCAVPQAFCRDSKRGQSLSTTLQAWHPAKRVTNGRYNQRNRNQCDVLTGSGNFQQSI